MFPWMIGIIGLVLIAVILEREIYFYEGAHLGLRVQGWLYDRWAADYDSGKHESQIHDSEVLARPLLQKLNGGQPLILDVATGTGRLPAALLSESGFKGRIVAVDLSREMLVRAAEKLAPYGEHVTLIRHTALSLPFPDHSFDVVSCVEALELMPNMQDPIAELARVLRPGGILLTTRGTEASGRVGKIVSTDKFKALLLDAGFEQIEIIPWWTCFDRVLARKVGQSPYVGIHPLTEILKCPACGTVALAAASPRVLHCEHCKAKTPVTSEGIVLY
jgi:SAM-dependent methyltransferase